MKFDKCLESAGQFLKAAYFGAALVPFLRPEHAALAGRVGLAVGIVRGAGNAVFCVKDAPKVSKFFSASASGEAREHLEDAALIGFRAVNLGSFCCGVAYFAFGNEKLGVWAGRLNGMGDLPHAILASSGLVGVCHSWSGSGKDYFGVGDDLPELAGILWEWWDPTGWVGPALGLVSGLCGGVRHILK